MSYMTIDGCRIHYRVEGPASAPALLLSNSLGTDLGLWGAQVPAFSARFRLVRYDSRGHGGSDAPQGPYTIERLGHDALALLDHLEIGRARLCGLSKGGIARPLDAARARAAHRRAHPGGGPADPRGGAPLQRRGGPRLHRGRPRVPFSVRPS